MAESHAAPVHEVGNGAGGVRDPRLESQHKPAAIPAAAAGGRAHRPTSAGNGRKGCTMSPQRVDRLSSSVQAGRDQKPGLLRDSHLHLPHAAKMTNSWQEAPLTPLSPPSAEWPRPRPAGRPIPPTPPPSARRWRIGARRRGAGPEPGARGRCSINTGPLHSLRVAIPPRAEANLGLRASQLPASPPLRVLRVASSHRRRHERSAQRLPRGVH